MYFFKGLRVWRLFLEVVAPSLSWHVLPFQSSVNSWNRGMFHVSVSAKSLKDIPIFAPLQRVPCVA